MISNDFNIDFLQLNYSNIFFLINKEEIETSLILNHPKLISSKLKYFDKIIKYKDKLIPLFDLDYFIIENFLIKQKNEFHKLVLILPINKFINKNIEILKNFYRKNKIENIISDEHIGMIITSNTKLTQIYLTNLILLPNNINKELLIKGIIAIQFDNDNNGNYINFLIDLENILFNHLFLIKKENNK